ncbi:MAG: hypothetical protein LQ340_006599, partial [Diploschistes diacapsis]
IAQRGYNRPPTAVAIHAGATTSQRFGYARAHAAKAEAPAAAAAVRMGGQTARRTELGGFQTLLDG